MSDRNNSHTPEAAAFLQRRVALFGLVGAILGGIAWVITVAQMIAQGMPLNIPVLVVHLGGAFVPFVGWFLCRGPTVRSRRFVERLEALVTTSCAACFVVMVSQYPLEARPDFIVILIVSQIIMTRAIFVPSSPRRTAVISTIAMAPILVVAFRMHRLDAVFGALTWLILGVILAVATSSVIYGLRKAVREAQELGQYTLLEKLGEGGMGAVFRARHAMLRRPTAVKLLHAASPEDLARFEREVQLTAQLTHPNTVTVFDYGRTPDGIFYYAMELLDGADLQKLVEAHGPMPAARVIHVLAQVSDALAEAHAVGLIHRDIKPANIILCARATSSDVAKVVDFGLVKRINQTGDDEAPVSTRGQAMGTPLYIAPETLTHPDFSDLRTDLYSLGAVGYFLLTGTPVFEDPTLPGIIAAHLNRTPDAPSARLGAPIAPDLEAIVLDCLAKAPAGRPRDARALGDRLRSCADAAGWSDDDARAWWVAAAASKVGKKDDDVSWSAKTLAVDFEQKR